MYQECAPNCPASEQCDQAKVNPCSAFCQTVQFCWSAGTSLHHWTGSIQMNEDSVFGHRAQPSLNVTLIKINLQPYIAAIHLKK